MASTKPTMEQWSKQQSLDKITEWAANGLSVQQMANNISITRTTLYDWMNKNTNISNAIKKGREQSDEEVENALFKRATGYSYREITEEDKGGNMQVTKIITKHMPAEVGAMVFWLKNRKPNEWRDKQGIAFEGDVENVPNFADAFEKQISERMGNEETN